MYDLKTKWIKLNYEVERLNAYILKLETEIKLLRIEKIELEAENEKLKTFVESITCRVYNSRGNRSR
jgi:hypothetical protein